MKNRSPQWDQDQSRHLQKKIRQKVRDTRMQMIREIDEKWERKTPNYERDDQVFKRYS